MSNNYFQFKQFTVHQDRSAMKVCTDACLFGSLVAGPQDTVYSSQPTASCLDIGAGTGLLSLMYAQKNPSAIIDAIEIDQGAAGQAKENFEASPWAGRLHIYHEDVLAFRPGKKYDRIISNPPFFEDELQSPDKIKNNAKHDTSLLLKQLLQVVEANLTNEGLFAVLLPYQRLDYFIQESRHFHFHLIQQVLVKQTIKHDFFRGILFFSKRKGPLQNTEIIIKDSDGKYTAAFVAALKDYYLYL